MKENRPLGGLRLPSTRDMAWNMVQLGSLALAVALAYVIRFEGVLDAQNIFLCLCSFSCSLRLQAAEVASVDSHSEIFGSSSLE